MKLFEIQGVGLSRADGNGTARSILEDISFDLSPGDCVIVTGPSGAGKTSLLRLLNRLEEPSAGVIHYRGRPLIAHDPPTLRRRVGLVSQVPRMLCRTVIEELEYGRRLGPPGSRDAMSGREAYDNLGLPEKLLYEPTDRLSGGEQQRIALARTLAVGPEVLLLDEPTSALDPGSKGHVRQVLRGFLRRRETAVVLVTHDLGLAGAVGTQVLILSEGKVVERGEPAAAIRDPQSPIAQQFIERAKLKATGERIGSP